jgi:hypothetical protein
VFRVLGDGRLVPALEELRPVSLLVAGGAPAAPTVCLVAVAHEGVRAFGRVVRELAATGVVERVEADPHL